VVDASFKLRRALRELAHLRMRGRELLGELPVVEVFDFGPM
jgi:hypothetical protein